VALSRVLPRALLALVLAALGCVVLRTPAALADADPASDTLLVQDAFLPYTPVTPAPLQRSLDTALREIGATGLHLKVAVIASPVDLGGIPELYGQPSRYARFLDTELSSHGPQPLLVVMGNGLSVQHAGPASALAGLAATTGRAASGTLVKTAVLAVERIAAERGHPIAPVSLRSAHGAGSSTGVVVIGVIAVALLVASGLAIRSPRRRPRLASASGS
jgi:hypothetical protein